MRKTTTTTRILLGVLMMLAGRSAPAAEIGKIMCLGDSITYGWPGSNAGYRGPLHDLLNATSSHFEFVGASTVTYSGTARPHNGYSSYGTLHLLNNLDGLDSSIFNRYGGAERDPHGGYWLTGGNGTGRSAVFPDVVLLMAGTNDINYSNEGDPLFDLESQYQANLTSLVNRIIELSPGVSVYVARITPWAGRDALVATVNSGVDAAVATLQAEGKNVTMVDLNTGFPAGAQVDGVHPNDVGYNWMAQQWFNAICTPDTSPLQLNSPGVSGVSPTSGTVSTDITENADQVVLYWDTVDHGAQAAGWANTVDLGPWTGGAGTVSTGISGLLPDTRYSFRFWATSAGLADDAWSPPGDLDTDFGPFQVPTGVAATAVNSVRISLTWTDGFATETGFVVRRADDMGFTTNVQEFEVAPNSEEYGDPLLTPETTYYYKVAARNDYGVGAFSDVVSATTLSDVGGGGVTNYLGGDGVNGNLDNGSAWSAGLPSSINSPAGIAVSTGNPVTAALNSSFGGGVTFNHTAGDVDYDGWQFNLFGSNNTYNLSGGNLTVGRWIVNGATYNVIAGTVTGTNASTGTHSFANNGRINLSGSGTISLDELNRNNGGHHGAIDIAAGWDGSFTIGNVANGSTIEGAWTTAMWESMFTTNGLLGGNLIHATYNGAALDDPAAFHAIFQVTDGGTTLSLAGGGDDLALRIDAAGDDLVFTWDSKAGKLYDLLSSTTLEGDPMTWPVWQADIVATPDVNTETFARPASPATFFVLVEKDIPPLLSESFDGAAALPAGWLSSGPSNGTDWEVGVPSGVGSGPAAAVSPPNCAGTNIGGYYTANADVSLTSPAFAIPPGAGATLTYQQLIDTDGGGDFGSVRILDADNGDAPLFGVINLAGTGVVWTAETLGLPASLVGGKNIKIEFRFQSNGGDLVDQDVWGGFYIDNVAVNLD